MSEISKYHLVCGMEVHAELKTNSKMFCGCKNDPFGAKKPNTHTCPVCLGMPGALPVANKKAIEWTIKLGLALNCKINLFSKFDRKNYFYPDLPKAYQISQYDIPFCHGGVIETSEGPIRITRIHLEEDTGKLLHKEINGEDVSLIDYNRSSVPLVEIVTEPDIKSPTQAEEYGRALRDIIRYIDIGNCDMEQGGMRLEANISLQINGKDGLPTYKTEVKNINSFKFARQAIEFEMERQEEILEAGNIPIQETRGWNAKKSETFSQRTKEDAEDYRYFPDPDLPPIRFTKEQVETIGETVPTLPKVLIKDWENNYSVEERFSSKLFSTPEEAKWLEELFSAAKSEGIRVNKLAGAIVNKKVKHSLSLSATEVISEFKKLNKTDDISDEELISAIEQVIIANPIEVGRYKDGQTKLLNFFFGQTMRTLGKKVNGGKLRSLLSKQLEK